MKYNPLGSTGLQVSEIGLGCEGFLERTDAEAEALFRTALEHGVNCMDLYSPNPLLHQRVGRAIRTSKKPFVLQGHLCTLWEKGQYRATRKIEEVKAAFEAQMQNLNVDTLDVGMIHYVDSPETWRVVAEGPILEYALRLKEEGRIRHIGLSSHNPLVALEAVRSGAIEVLMFSVNPCYDLLPGTEDVEALWADESYTGTLINLDPKRAELYELCQRVGVGITVMKAFGGGDLLDAQLSPAGVALTPFQCLHYALSRPGVAAVMAGAHSAAELEATLAYEDASEAEKDYAAAFAAFPRIHWQGHCMYCGHCAPCPMGIDVASVSKLLNLVRAQGSVPETVREHYRALAHHADECIECGACEQRCPFSVPVLQNMKEAAQRFSAVL